MYHVREDRLSKAGSCQMTFDQLVREKGAWEPKQYVKQSQMQCREIVLTA